MDEEEESLGREREFGPKLWRRDLVLLERLPWVSPTFSIRSFFNPSEQTDRQADRLEAGGGGRLLWLGWGSGSLLRGTGQCPWLSHTSIAFVKVKSSSGSRGETRTDDLFQRAREMLGRE